MPRGLRVYCTALASARYSRCRETADWIKREEHADVANDDQGNAKDDDALATVATVVAAARAMHAAVEDAAAQDTADHGDADDAEQHAHQANVQPHVAVEDVAELVRDDSL